MQASNTAAFTALANSNSTRLSYDGLTTANSFEINRLYYKFPIGDSFKAYIAPIGATEDVIDPLNPLESDSQGTISRFGRFSPLIRLASNSLTTGLGVAGFDWAFTKNANLQVAWSAGNVASPSGVGGVAGQDKIAAQLVYKPLDSLTLGVGYANARTNCALLTDTALASGLNGDNTAACTGLGATTNLVTGNLIWDITKKFTFNTWGAYSTSNVFGSAAGSTQTSWMAALSAKDLFSEGDLAAVMFGQPLHTTSVNNAASPLSPDRPYHLEALYRFRVSKNITITPGVFFVFNQDSNAVNGTATVGVLRTTFSF